MNAEAERFKVEIESVRDAAQLRLMLVEMKQELLELQAREEERRKAEAAMYIQYQKAAEELRMIREENALLKKELEHLSDQNALKANTLFGRRTEKLAELTGSCGEAAANPIDEDAAETDVEETARTAEGSVRTGDEGSMTRKPSGHHGKRRRGKHAEDLSKLPSITRYEFHPGELDEMYGKGQWRVVCWNETVKKSYIPSITYKEITCTPVLSIGLEHRMERILPEHNLLPGSDATPSLVSAVMNSKFGLGLPLNRQSDEFARFDTVLSRQTMSNWILRFSRDNFYKVYTWMKKLLVESGCTQSDETTLLVIHDDRKAGTRSFMWVHITSELAECAPIAVFSYEKTRSAQHLRDFYGEDYVGKIICDAYCAYHVYGEEHCDTVVICGCWMHARRRWAESLRLRNVKGMTKEEIDKLPEVQALNLISDIYKADGELKSLAAAERLKGRKTVVTAKVNAYYEFLDTFDMDNPAVPERMKDAISYSRNQREYLIRFLSDASVPVDNGACERRIRPFATGRRSWMFCSSMEGAEAAGIIYTLIETAKLNGANPYYYLKYLLENAPVRSMPDLGARSMNELMPWSETYKTYEQSQKQAYLNLLLKASEPEPDIRKARKKSA